MNAVLRFLFGTCEMSFPPERKTEVLNFLLKNGIGAVSFGHSGGEGRLTLFRRDVEKIPETLCTLVSEHGAIPFFFALFRRPGLIVGGAFVLVLLVLSSLTVWRLEIEGNSRLGEVEIEAAVANAGLAVGDFFPMLDISAIKTKLLRENPEISWVGIYLRGTTARIEIREASIEEKPHAQGGFCNLVAAKDAVIERVDVDAGRAVVSPGMTVRAGELLISGIYSTATGLRATRASGAVFARSEATVTVYQSFATTERAYVGSATESISIEFFGKNIKLFKKSGKNDAEYDIIRRKEQLVLFGRIALPIFWEQSERILYRTYTVTLTEDEVVRMAYSQLRAEMAARFFDAEILSERIYGEWTDGGYRLSCQVEYIADVAVPLAYDVENNGG